MKSGSIVESVFVKIDFIHLLAGDISLFIGDFRTEKICKSLFLKHKYKF
ncbi:hypothetical protein M2338_002221 [Sphingobium sp. B2D3B]|nr:hypothetical protein [Sphingobium sp. B2D3B]MCW2397171.1 hypothetical protein [Sphingobium sp. B2D3C]